MAFTRNLNKLTALIVTGTITAVTLLVSAIGSASNPVTNGWFTDVSVAGTVEAGAFSGDGSGLTGITFDFNSDLIPDTDNAYDIGSSAARVAEAWLVDATVAGTMYSADYQGITLDDIGGPEADHSITMADKTLTWNFTNPAGGILYNWTGAASGHQLELNQNTGNMAAGTHLLHIEGEDEDLLEFHVMHDGAQTSHDLARFSMERASPADNDEFSVLFGFNHDGSATTVGYQTYASITPVQLDATEDSEDGQIDWDVITGGSLATAMSLNGTGLDLKSGTLTNASNVYVSGGTDVPVTDGGTGVSSCNAYAPVVGGTTDTGALQCLASEGTAGQVLTSGGAGALPAYGDADDVITRIVELQPYATDEDWAAADGIAYFRVPVEMNGWNLVDVEAYYVTAGTTGTSAIDVYNLTQTADMLSTAISIDSGEIDSSTADTPPVIDTANDDVATGDKIRIDSTTIHTTPAQGGGVVLTFQKP